MIIDEFESKGYSIKLVDDYDIRVVNPFGKKIKNPPSHARKHPKWQEFKDLRKIHRREVAGIKHEFLRSMMMRKEVDTYITTSRKSTVTNITMADLYSVVENMYVEARVRAHDPVIQKEPFDETWRGFVTGYNDTNLLVDGKMARLIRMLHPSEIDDLWEVQKQAIIELRDTHIMQLFRPTFEPEIDEEYYVMRFLEIPIKANQAYKVIDTYDWKVPRLQNMPEEGTVAKYFTSKDNKYMVRWQYSLDYPRGKSEWESGTMEFFLCHDGIAPQPCRVVDVDPVVFSEAVWEIQKIIDTCRVDDEVSKTTMTYRQNIAKIYMDALHITNCEIVGSVIKVYGDWGIYGISLKDGRSMWWSNKRYICIQPLTGHERPKYGAYLVGDGVLDDPTLALAIAKMRDLSDDTHPIDEVEGRQIRPENPNRARDGMNMEDVRREKEIFLQGRKIW